MAEWREWPGGNCPEHGAVLVQTKRKNGHLVIGPAATINWHRSGDSSDVIAYRVVGPKPEKGAHYVPVNEHGHRLGEYHQNSKLSDADVEMIRTLHEDQGVSYDDLAAKFDCSRWTVSKICQYARRAETIAGWKKVEGGNGKAR